jgi:hypothetical protein
MISPKTSGEKPDAVMSMATRFIILPPVNVDAYYTPIPQDKLYG